jgi:hypothetical protein
MARKRHFKSARAAAADLGVAPATYGAHERAQASGGRDYGPEEAALYGQRFNVRPEWLLTGKGEPDESPQPAESAASRVIASIDRLIAALDRHSDRLERVHSQLETPPLRTQENATTALLLEAIIHALSLPPAERRHLLGRRGDEGLAVELQKAQKQLRQMYNEVVTQAASKRVKAKERA